ncbi:Y-family DNA polymerase [Azospirillum agricola]|uniref:Y-family DNA polymerase n=1 Tax=Azospirillum agricola TaxID=1720247 RepID=UPI000A0EEF78|nr:DNA polymerase Y family protein [Azospirillum agricola]SMH52728.1 protein ImuB [Azospirillum lipoferum]
MARRILALWLPRLPTDARTRGPAADRRALPLALLRTERGRRLVVAVNRVAETAGILPGLTLADARALLPGLDVADATPEDDARLLDRIAGWCRRYSPWTAPDGTDGVMIDITGCAHLFGGEAALLADLHRRLRDAGFAARAAIAATPAAAWGLARFGDADSRRREALDALPMAALRLPVATLDGLAAVGLRRIGDLHALPRAALATRFGDGLLRRFDQALGRLDEPVSPHRPVEPHEARLAFAEPIATADTIAAAMRHLLGTLCAGLEAAGHGARRLVLEAHRTDRRLDDAPQRLTLGASRPTRDPAVLARLFGQILEQVEPGPGIETMILAATETAPLGAIQAALDGEGDDSGLGELVDRLGTRLGERAVLRLVPRESWLPERSVAPARPLGHPPPNHPSLGHPSLGCPPAAGDSIARWPDDRPRPVRLFSPPEPVEATAPVPDDPPLQFRWRGVLHRVRRADGPERIETEWWRPGAGRGGNPRDYYRVEDRDGRRFWLFRDGLYRPDTPPDAAPRWYLHGFFG